MKRKMAVTVLTIALVLTMLVGCGSQTGSVTGTTSGATKDSTPAKDSLVIVTSADIAGLDPMHNSSTTDYQIMYDIFNALVTVDENGKFVGDLAENWTVSPDGLSYTFKLKKGVKFHNGEEFKASDVLYSVKTAKASPYMAEQSAPIKDAVAIDDYTVKLNLNYPYAPFLSACCFGFFMVNEKAYSEAGDKNAQNPVGTGPYKFVKHETGQRILLERNDEYFKGPAKIKKVEYKVITDPNTAWIALQAGEVDFAFTLPAISLTSAKNDSKLTCHEFDSTRLMMVLMNNNKKPFDNVLVRQAINYALDKDSIIQISEEGKGKKANSILNSLSFGYSENVKGYEFNVEKAKELLTKAGYPNGFRIKLITRDGVYKKAAEVIQQNLAKIGITIDIEMLEKNTHTNNLKTGNYEMANVAISLTGADADMWAFVFASTGGFNVTGYKNTKVDDLFLKGKQETDANKRIKIYEELYQTLNDDAPVVPLYHVVNTYVGKKELKIGYIESSGMTRVADMSWGN